MSKKEKLQFTSLATKQTSILEKDIAQPKEETVTLTATSCDTTEKTKSIKKEQTTDPSVDLLLDTFSSKANDFQVKSESNESTFRYDVTF